MLTLAVALVAAVAPGVARAAEPAGDFERGRAVFQANCGSCHRLAEAGTQGSFGPNLDALGPSYAQVLRQVTQGGGSMPSFAGQLSAQEIRDVATFVWRGARTRLSPARPPRVAAGLRAELLLRLGERPTSLLPLADGALVIGTAKGRLWRVAPGAAAATLAGDGFRDAVLGLAVLDADELVVADSGRVQVVSLGADGAVAGARTLVDGLPVGLHANAGVGVHGGRVYLSIGSTCNACRPADPRSGTVASVLPDGTGFRIEARGLRNAFDLAWNRRGWLFAGDTGRNDRLDVADELNRIRRGGRYGWPACPGPRAGAGRCRGTLPPLLRYEPRSTPSGIAFAPAAFGARYAGDLVVAHWGSYVPGSKAGRYVSRTVFRGSRPVRWERLVRGLVRPIDVAFARDGALLVADFGSGAIWRVRRTG